MLKFQFFSRVIFPIKMLTPILSYGVWHLEYTRKKTSVYLNLSEGQRPFKPYFLQWTDRQTLS